MMVVVTGTPPSVQPGHQKVRVAFESEGESVKVQRREVQGFWFCASTVLSDIARFLYTPWLLDCE